MKKRIVDAFLSNGTVLKYRIGLRPTTLRLTDEEYIGIAKQYHIEDGLTLEAVEKWAVHPVGESTPPKPAQ